MKRIALIELTIMVDEDSPWRNLAHFEQYFDDFATAHGFEIEDVEVKGNANKLVKYVSKMQPVPTQAPALKFKPKALSLQRMK